VLQKVCPANVDIIQCFDRPPDSFLCNSNTPEQQKNSAFHLAAMLQQQLQAPCPASQRGSPLLSRPAAARPSRSSRLLPARVSLADLGVPSPATDSSSSPAASACPFLAASAPRAAPHAASSVPAELASLSGDNWHVLPNGNSPQLPEPQGRWSWNPLLGEVRLL
jgi:hypothetical protein